jgi:methylase of polypeptide subunit release factors
MEHGFDQKDAMHKIFDDTSFCVIETLKDYAGLDRITAVRKKV